MEMNVNKSQLIRISRHPLPFYNADYDRSKTAGTCGIFRTVWVA
jgi:hypothetical protein